MLQVTQLRTSRTRRQLDRLVSKPPSCDPLLLAYVCQLADSRVSQGVSKYSSSGVRHVWDAPSSRSSFLCLYRDPQFMFPLSYFFIPEFRGLSLEQIDVGHVTIRTMLFSDSLEQSSCTANRLFLGQINTADRFWLRMRPLLRTTIMK